MLHQIFTFLLQVACGLVVGLCLLRLYMQFQRVPLSARSGNPVGPLVFALTDWLVLPLRRVVPSFGRLDSASLVAAYVVELAQFMVLWLLAGAHEMPFFVPLLALFGIARLAISGLSVLVIVFAILSWVQPQSPMMGLLARLVAPLLQPVRRLIPLAGGVDLSPLVVLVLLQVGAMVLESLQTGLLA